MQLHPARNVVFGDHFKTEDILALVATLPTVSTLILEAIDELWRREGVQNRAIIEELFSKYQNARFEDLRSELGGLAERYELTPAEREEDDEATDIATAMSDAAEESDELNEGGFAQGEDGEDGDMARNRVPHSSSSGPSLIEKARRVVAPMLWAQAQALVDADAVSLGKHATNEETWLVHMPPRPAPFEVTLWPAEADWYCTCETPGCVHLGAVVIARASGRFDQKAASLVTWRLTRSPEGLCLAWDAPRDAEWTANDRLVQRLGREWLGNIAHRGPIVPRAILHELMGALAGLPLTLDGSPVTASADPVVPRAVVDDVEGGFRVKLVRAAGIDEAFQNGVVRLDTMLRPFTNGGLDVELKNRLNSGMVFRPDEVEELVTRFLPRLEKLVPVERRSTKLPAVVAVPPRLEWDIRCGADNGGWIVVTPRIVYGDPPVARIERGVLVRLGGAIPARDLPAERKLEAELGEMRMAAGSGSARTGCEAARWIEGLEPSVRAMILARAPQFRIDSKNADPEVTLGADGLSVHIDAGGADPRALLTGWQHHDPFVPLLEGGFRPVPRNWLDRFAPALAELLDARDANGRVPKHRAAVLFDAGGVLAPPVQDVREDEIKRIAAGIRHSKVNEQMLARVLNDEYDLEESSPMMLFGYSVAESRGLSTRDRSELLDDFMLEATIPSFFPEEYRQKWGAPRTATRRGQMLSHLNWLIRTRGRSDPAKYEAAIEKWETDAGQLRELPGTRRPPKR